MIKRIFQQYTFFFFLLVALLLHGLFLLLPHLSASSSILTPPKPLMVTYTRVKTIEPPEQTKNRVASAPNIDPPIQLHPKKEEVINTKPISDIKTPTVTNQPFTSELTPATSSGAGNLSGSSEAEDLLNNNLPLWQELNRKLKAAVIYPLVARKRGLEGQALVLFELDEAGQLKQLQLMQSTGHELLDKEVLAAVRRITPFKHGLGQSIRVQLPLRYQLEK